MKLTYLKNGINLLVIIVLLGAFSCNSPLTPEKSYKKILKAGLSYEIDSLEKYVLDNKSDTVELYLNASKFKPSLFGENDKAINKTRELFLMFYTYKAAISQINESTYEIILKYHDADNFNFLMENASPLLMAIEGKSVNIVGKLLQKGVNVNLSNSNGLTPLFSAINTYNYALIDTILNYNPNVNTTTTNKNISPLMNIFLQSESINNHLTLVQKMIDMGANINDKVKMGGAYFTPLDFAIRDNNIDVLKYLLKNGANPNIVNKYGTSLNSAVDVNSPEIIELLFKYNADFNTYSKSNMPAIFLAIRENQPECVKIFLENGQSPHKKYSIMNRQGNYSAYEIAKTFDNYNIIKLMESYTTSIEEGNIINNTVDTYKTYAVIDFSGGNGTCPINHVLSVSAIEGKNYISSVDNYSHSCWIGGDGENGIQGNYRFTLTYYSQCIGFGEPDGPYSYSNEFYIDGKHEKYVVTILPYNSVEVKGY